MQVLRSYVIRIYRQEVQAIAGVIESVETGETTRFHSCEDLCAVVARIQPSRRAFHFDTKDEEDSK